MSDLAKGWTMAQAKRDFGLGLLRSFELHWWIDAWVVFLVSSVPVAGFSAPLLDARTESPRRFKTADAAVRSAQEVGFRVSVLMLKGGV